MTSQRKIIFKYEIHEILFFIHNQLLIILYTSSVLLYLDFEF